MFESKIKIAHIGPSSYTGEALEVSDGVYMGLQHLCEDPAYTVKLSLRNSKTYLFMDNSFCELGGKSCSFDEVLLAALRTKANCVILPDGDLSQLSKAKKEGFDVMYVPVYEEGKDFLLDIVQALKNPDINFVGLGLQHTARWFLYPNQPEAKYSRLKLFEKLIPLLKGVPHIYKKIHILGGTTPEEFVWLSKYHEYINSWDTSMAFNAAIRDIPIESINKKLPNVDLHIHHSFNLDILRRIHHNTGYLKGLVTKSSFNKNKGVQNVR